LWDFIKVFQNTHTITAGSGTEPRRNEYKSTYSNFIQIEDREPVLTQNKLYAEGANALHLATTAQLSSLVPKFKLFKSIKNGDKEKNIEFPFKKFTTVQSIVESDLGRGTDVGFLSVNWTDTGTNPANVGVAFSGDLSLKFQSFEALFQKRKSGDSFISFADLLNPEELTGRKITKNSKKQPDSSNIDDFKTSIKMVVGWEYPEDTGGDLGVKEIRDELELLQRTYIIKNIDHSIDIGGQDASITVNIKFTARIEGMLLSTRSDLLYIDPALEGEVDKKARRSLEEGKKVLLEKKKNVKEQIKKAKEQKEKSEIDENVSGNTDLNKDIENLEKELEELNKSLKYNISETRAIAYRRLLVALRSNFSEPSKNSDGKIRYIDIDESLYRSYLSLLKDAAKSRDELKEEQQKAKETAEKQNEPRLNDPNLSPDEKRQIVSDIQQQVKSTRENFQENYKKDRLKSLKELQSQVINAMNSTGPSDIKSYGAGENQIIRPDKNDKEYKPSFYRPAPGTIRMHYFYLGDLIEAAMEVIYKRSLTKNNKLTGVDQVQSKDLYNELKLILGAFVYYNPVTEESIKMPLCDVPISFNYFNAWYYENVIKRSLKNYPLRNFLRDLCSKLLNNVMSPTRYGAVNPIKTFSTRIQSVRMQKDATLSQYWKNSYGRIKIRWSSDSLIAAAREKSTEEGRSSINQTEWVYLYTVGSNSDFLAKSKGKSTFNISNDIPHFYVGGSKGVLKSVSFSRTNIPGKLEAALSSGEDPARKNLLFQNKYDAKIEIFGNPVYKPGMLIYLDPRGVGLGTPEGLDNIDPGEVDFKYDLGIGGYYRVVNVTNTLSSGIFTTTLSTVAELDLRDIRILNKKASVKTS
jgi:hypothetical protein